MYMHQGGPNPQALPQLNLPEPEPGFQTGGSTGSYFATRFRTYHNFPEKGPKRHVKLASQPSIWLHHNVRTGRPSQSPLAMIEWPKCNLHVLHSAFTGDCVIICAAGDSVSEPGLKVPNQFQTCF